MLELQLEHREQLFRRKLYHARLQRLLEQQGLDLPLRDVVTIYRVRRAVPVVRPIITNRQELRELRARKLANRGLGDAQKQTRNVIYNNDTHTNTNISGE